MNINEIDERKKKLKKLIRDYWIDYLEKREDKYWENCSNGKNVVVKPSIPIVWFGNIDKYFSSDLRIVTIGLNPSDNEFPNGTFSRFQAAEDLADYDISDDYCINKLFNSYNKYFDKAVQKKLDKNIKRKKDKKLGEHEGPCSWFMNGFEKNVFEVFPEISVSYGYNIAKNTAIHIDFQTALATNPTWSKLKSKQQTLLNESGRKLYKKLFEILDPHIMLFSQAPEYLDFFIKDESKVISEKISEPLKKYKNGRMAVRNSYSISGKLFIFGTYSGTSTFGMAHEGEAGKKDRENASAIFHKMINDYKTW